jgi:hypothetical protein
MRIERCHLGKRVRFADGAFAGRVGKVVKSAGNVLVYVALDDFTGGGQSELIPVEPHELRPECVIEALGDVADG